MNRYMAMSLICVAAALDITSATAKEPMPDPLRAVSDKAMEKLKENDLSGVFDALHLYGKWNDEQRSDELQDWKKRRESRAILIGNPVGETEFLKKEIVGKSFVRFTYLENWTSTPSCGD